jgi:hypothetical protein
MKKSYKIVDFNEEFPVYFEGMYPKTAAVKAFQHLLKFVDIKNFEDEFIVFNIEQVGKNSTSKKTHKYIGARIALAKPVTRIVNGIKTKYYFKDVVGKYNPELDKL